MTSPEYQAPTWVNEDDPDFVEGVSPDLGAGYLNQMSGAVEDHGQRLGAVESDVTTLQATALDQADGDARYILQSNANGFAPAEATANALAGKAATSANLSDLASAATARTNLGLAAAAASGKLADLTDVTTTGAAVGGVPTAMQLTGGTPTQWKVLRQSAPTPQLHGAVGDGVADDTAALNAWAAAGYTEGYIPPGTYLTSTGVVQSAAMSVTLAAEATIKATAAMPTLWGTPLSTDATDRRLTGGTFDCNNLADTGIRICFAHVFRLSRTRIHRAASHSLVIGDPAAPQVTAQVFADSLNITRPNGDPAPGGSYGIWVRRAYDCHFNVANIVGAGAASVRVDVGANYFTEVHAWGYPGAYPDVCFDDNADENYWFGCMADTPNVYAFRLRQFRTYLEGCHSYINFVGADNVVPGIYLDKTGADATIMGHFFEGEDASHRLAADVTCSDMTGSWMSYFTAIGHRWQNVAIQNLPRHNFTPGARFRSASGVAAATFSGNHADLLLVEQFNGTDAFRVNTSGATAMPQFPNGADVRGYSDVYATQRWRLDGVTGGVTPGKYTTATRPAASVAGHGAMIYDTTLSKPIWSDNATWRDAAGTIV